MADHVGIERGGYGWDDAVPYEIAPIGVGTGVAAAKVDWLSDYQLYNFPDNAYRHIQANIQLPHSYANGTDLLWHVHFVTTDNLGAGATVIFKADVVWANVGSAFSSPQTVTSTYTNETGATIPANTHLITDSAVIEGERMKGSAFVVADVYRYYSDTHGYAVLYLGSDFHIKKNRLGSPTEMPYGTSE